MEGEGGGMEGKAGETGVDYLDLAEGWNIQQIDDED